MQAENICYSVLCVFSYVAAGHEQKKVISSKGGGALTPTSTVSAPAMTMSTESADPGPDHGTPHPSKEQGEAQQYK